MKRTDDGRRKPEKKRSKESGVEKTPPTKKPVSHPGALVVACREGRIAAVERMLGSGCNAGGRARAGCTPLGAASSAGHVAIVEMLLRGGAPVDGTGTGDASPLGRACDSGHSEVVQALLRAGADVNRQVGPSGATPLIVSASRGNMGIARLLMDAGADARLVDTHGHNPLHAAAECGAVDIIDRLLLAGIEINAGDYGGRTALWFASSNGRVAAVERLLRAGADSSAGRVFPLMAAIVKRHADVVAVLISAGADVNLPESNTPPLCVASEMGMATIVGMLLAAGAASSATNSNSRIPLYLAINSGDAATVSSLARIGTGASAWCHGSCCNGGNMLHHAVSRGIGELVLAMMDARVDIDTRNSYGQTALYQAASRGNGAIVEILLRHGANPNIANNDGWTPLTIAASRGHADVAVSIAHRGATLVETPVSLVAGEAVRRKLLGHSFPIWAARASLASGNPFGLLAGFPEILKLIVTLALPSWMRTKEPSVP